MMEHAKSPFVPIVGAKVDVNIYKSVVLAGKLVAIQLSPIGKTQLVIYTNEKNGCIVVDASHVTHLKATMKPKDMNPEQLHRLADEIALEHYGEQYPGIEYIAFVYEADGKLSDEICVDLRGMSPKDGFVLDSNKPYDVTHWVKGEANGQA